MHKRPYLLVFMIAYFLVFSLFSSLIPCLAQSSAESKVYELYQKFKEPYERGRYKEAMKFAKELVPAGEKAFGKDHPYTAIFLNNLAGLYKSLGDYARAEPLYKRSLAIREKALGPEHPDVARSLNNLAALYATVDDFLKAHELFKKAQRIDGKLIDQVMGFTSEEQKMKFLSIKKGSLYSFMSLVGQYLSGNPPARKHALDVWLRRKGIILEAQKRFQEALVYSDDPEAIKTFQELAGVRARLSTLAFGGPGKEGVEVYKRWITDLEAQKEVVRYVFQTFAALHRAKVDP